MRTCPVTTEQFEPNSPDHYFNSEEAFNKHIKSIDPTGGKFEPKKREINWSPQKRIDPNTGKEFYTEHPAQIFARTTEKTEKKAPTDLFEAQEKECAKCHRKFLKTKPAMKYCEECSDKGGELLE